MARTRDLPPFARELTDIMHDRRLRGTVLAERMAVTPAYVSSLTRGMKNPGPQTVDKVLKAVEANAEEGARLHRAAAESYGFKLRLPPGV